VPARERFAPSVAASGYREHRPAAALAPYVECFWTRHTEAATAPGATQRILPDGCIDIIFDLGDRAARLALGAWADDRAYVVGTMTTALVLGRPGRSHIVAVRFQPGGAYALLGVGASELTDRRVPLDDVWGDRGETLSRLLESDDDATRLGVLERALLARLAPERRDALVEAAVARIVARGGSEPVDAVASAIGATRQHLARRFAERVGVSPKMLARVARLQRVVARVSRVPSGRRPSWSALALECGYYDQAHLAGEFRSLVGQTPVEWSLARE
jgi:AraC-like DNA-binding protein